MCTVVTHWHPGAELRILAIRDELLSREFDEPGAWWPDRPGVVGGRDSVAGGSWCVSDVATGVTALVLNRPDPRIGTPSRGTLPLAGVEHGASWSDHVEHRRMAGFTLVLAGPDGVRAWDWVGGELTRHDLEPGMHLFTSSGVDPDTPKGRNFAPRFAAEDWLEIVTGEEPVDDLDALLIRHEVDTDAGREVYGTVFGQLLVSEPGRLTATYSRTPWEGDGWRELVLPQPVPDRR